MRTHEIGIRSSLGASRARIAGQLMVETVVVFLVGGAAALVIAWGCIRLMLASWAFPLPGFITIQLDWPVLAFALVLTLLAGVASALAPAMLTSQLTPFDSIKDGGRGVTRSRGRRRLASILVGAEIALALVLLTSAGLMVKSLSLLYTADPGFDTRNLMAIELSLPGSRYRRSDQMTAFVRSVDRTVSSVAGITASGWTTIPPLYPFRSAGRDISIDGHDYNRAAPPHAELRVIGPQYFSTLGVSVVEGREFTAFDDENAPPAAIVNRAMARRYWPDQVAIGRRLRIGGPESTQPWLTIVGVVGDIHQLSRSTPPAPEIYIPYLASPRRSLFLVVRTAGSPEQLITTLKQAIWSVDPNLSATRFRTMDQATAEDVFPQRMMSNVLSVLSLFALLLAALGTYAIVSHAVTGRRQELAVRMTFGATRRDLIGLMFRQMSIAVSTGLVLGLGLSLGLGRSMQGLLFGITGFNPATVLVTTGTLIVCAGMAIYIPARRAASVDPMVALRQE